MQATELYELGCRAYDGDRDARRLWLAKVARLAMPYAVRYGVLPGLVAAKAALESGYGSDKYEEDFYEPQFGVKMARKAQNHNNLIGMNAFRDNMTFLSEYPPPAWESYRATFRDYGPHYKGSKIELVPDEPWMHFRNVEDCLEAWCANMRYQAEKNHKKWGGTLEEQLLAIESYTPEGAEAETPGMHYEWQDYVLYLYKDYDLFAIDREAYQMSVPMTINNLDENIKKAYEYAHANCHYAPTDRSFPPMEDGAADCVGLALRALYTMGYNHAPHNINEINKLCEDAGLLRSDWIDDAWKRHGVVCMRPKGDTKNVAHVYYSLGGTDAQHIKKYDLGSEERIRSEQPFANAPVNEWTDKFDFMCIWYVSGRQRHEDAPHFEVACESAGLTTEDTTIYSGPGTTWKKLKCVKEGTRLFLRGLVSNDKARLWYAVRHEGIEGYISQAHVFKSKFVSCNGVVSGTDGSLGLRIAAGVNAFKTADIPEGETVVVDNVATAEDGGRWYHVRWGKYRGFASAMYIKKKE